MLNQSLCLGFLDINISTLSTIRVASLKRKILVMLYFFIIIIIFNLVSDYLFILFYYYFWLCRVFVSVRGLSPVAASGGHSSSRCAGLSLSRPLLLRSTGSRRASSVVVAHRLSCSAACGIFPDQDPNPCPLHWQADSQPLRHQGNPLVMLYSFHIGLWCLIQHTKWHAQLNLLNPAFIISPKARLLSGLSRLVQHKVSLYFLVSE